ncbi:tyrosine-type recombinase/integrase [Mycolicibacterium monacense]|uniref:Core-binding (CB) domain-containing protein n=3 Tax=unclassified Mycobacterium TaxID=2642494 RepID=A0A5Q5BHM8_MYCSS|nr:site-specific integrase [Mycolicibacterium monacense]ORB23366.1 hypothetical protein BST34_03660 [Mycolicibacterium monacense DSM 44395]QHP85364.1 site-specific integrase [Mycolicibacterium monacense DSM 44395]
MTRKDGTGYVQVLYRLDGRQTSMSFEDLKSATKFKKLADRFGPAKALEVIGTDPELSTMTVGEWLEHHITHLTGVRKSTLYDYRSYAQKDIGPVLGGLPLAALSRDDVASWMQTLADKGASGKTIANKHGFLSSALNAAVRAGRIPSNPASGHRLPTSERREMVCLSRGDSDMWDDEAIDTERQREQDHAALARLLQARGESHAAAIVAVSYYSDVCVDNWNGGQYEACLAVPAELYAQAGSEFRDAIDQPCQAIVGEDCYRSLNISVRRSPVEPEWIATIVNAIDRRWVASERVDIEALGPAQWPSNSVQLVHRG